METWGSNESGSPYGGADRSNEELYGKVAIREELTDQGVFIEYPILRELA